MTRPVLALLIATAVSVRAIVAQPPASTQPVSPDFKTGTVRANGLNFSYIEAGEGPLVVALHGFPDHPRTFRHQMRALAGAGYRVVAPFQRGYAPSDVPPDGSYRTSALVADALGLIDALGEGRPAILIGHDWGAVAAHGAAAVAPEKVSKLVTMAVPAGAAFSQSLLNNPAQQRRSWYMYFFGTPFAEAAVQRDSLRFLDRLWRDWSPGWKYAPAELDSVKGVMRRPGVLHAALNYYRENLGMSQAPPAPVPDAVRERAGGKIAVPTLYFVGANDGCIGVDVSMGVEEQFTGPFEKRVIARAGHFLHQERPEEVNRLILRFVGAAR